MTEPVTSTAWWGRFEFRDGETRRWRVGACRFQIERRAREWRIQRGRADDESRVDVGLAGAWESELVAEEVLRLVGEGSGSTLEIAPLAADRSLVARPEGPIELLAGESATLFVGSPVWIRVSSPAAQRDLVEFPAIRPSDTWFGSETTSGQLAYATRTAARLDMGNIQPLPHRLLTRVALTNRSKSHFHLERLLLPAPNLSIFRDDAERLRTEDVSLVLGEEEKEASVRVEPLSEDMQRWARLQGPREKRSPNILLRAMSALSL